jgi:MYXO-CTERM domain-containing protein
MISAACPDCSILLVTFPPNGPSDTDFITAAKEAASLGAVATSISWGGPEGGDPTGLNYTTPGHLVLAATGDDAYDFTDYPGEPATPGYPSSAPDVVGVGGTELFYYTGPTYDEAVWFATTGAYGKRGTISGCSTEFATPPWQASAIAGSGCNERATADIAAAASFTFNGVLKDIACYETGSGNGGWGSLGAEGTSASSPMVAAILTRLGLAETIADSIATGTTNWLYENPAAFNDLGSTTYPVDPHGSDTNAFPPDTCGSLCTAGPGWDGPSGLGTPNGKALWILSGGSLDAGVDASVDSGSSSSAGVDSGSSSSAGVDSGVDGAASSSSVVYSSATVASGAGTSTVTASGSSTGTPKTHPRDASVADATLGDAGEGDVGAGGGCSCTEASGRAASWAGFGWLAVAAAAFARRRRRTGER